MKKYLLEALEAARRRPLEFTMGMVGLIVCLAGLIAFGVPMFFFLLSLTVIVFWAVICARKIASFDGGKIPARDIFYMLGLTLVFINFVIITVLIAMHEYPTFFGMGGK